MSALDTYTWYLRTLSAEAPELRQYFADQLASLYALRSEDERQRFVGQLMREINGMLAQRQTGHRA
ncbi:MAG TPA: hypothetical protein VMW43_01715 [Bacteroidota bacterium]|nr:hypothetical protein [Bacteroidota bacterium]